MPAWPGCGVSARAALVAGGDHGAFFRRVVNGQPSAPRDDALRVARADRVLKPAKALGSAAIGRVDLVIRWGGGQIGDRAVQGDR